jgi:putative holliday junction resolvase
MRRLMGLDIGDKKIGVALSDPTEVLATPLTTIIRVTDDIALKEINRLAKKHDISRIIIGLPYSLDGSIGKQAEKVLFFTKQIEKETGIEIAMQDERLTSVSADQKLREAGKKGRKLKSEMDAAAASVILQAYLDEVNLNGAIAQLEPPNV